VVKEISIYNSDAILEGARDTFYLNKEGSPTLIPTGFGVLDAGLGGLGPGACGILAASTGVGKSSAMLSAMLSSKSPVGCVSLEDGTDVVGLRLLSAVTGIDSLKIRRKHLTSEELYKVNSINGGHPSIKNVYFTYPTAGSIEDVEESVAKLCDAGCKMIYCDYLQKVRGHREERRHEVAETFTRFQRAVARGGAAGIAISQFRRLADGERVPQIHHLKESGDLENEARVIILAHKIRDPEQKDRVRFRVAKSTYGGEYISWDMTRDESGTLRNASTLDWGEGEW